MITMNFLRFSKKSLTIGKGGQMMHKQIIAVDFDGILCENKWPEIGEPNTELIVYLIMMRKTVGAKIILWTCRAGEMLDKAVNWCSEHGLEFDAVNENLPHIVEHFGSDTRKIFANIYIDGGPCKKCSNECSHTTDVDHAKTSIRNLAFM